MFKKIIISKLSKIKIIESKVGKLILNIDVLNKIPDEYMGYQKNFKEAIKILDGIEDIFVDFELAEVTIFYDHNKLIAEKVVLWINKVKEIGIENYELIEKYGENDLDYVMSIINDKLNKAKSEI